MICQPASAPKEFLAGSLYFTLGQKSKILLTALQNHELLLLAWTDLPRCAYMITNIGTLESYRSQQHETLEHLRFFSDSMA